MKHQKSIIIAGLISLLAATSFVCSCFSGRSYTAPPAGINNDLTSINSAEENDNISDNSSAAPESETASSSETPSSEAVNSTETVSSTYSTSPQDPKENMYIYDKPESYLEKQYDINTDTYSLTEEEKSMADESLFVGDSICYGFEAWEVVPNKNVYAEGCVAAWNFFEYGISYLNRPAEFVSVLGRVNPQNVFLWMGMNDLNWQSSSDFCEKYRKIIDTALQNSTADVYVCAITPIRKLDFTDLNYITQFNTAIKNCIEAYYPERVYFIDFGKPLENSEGLLNEEYDGGDGIHLHKKGYYIAMHEINEQMKFIKDAPKHIVSAS